MELGTCPQTPPEFFNRAALGILWNLASTWNEGQGGRNLQVVGICCVQAQRGTGGISSTWERAVAGG